VIQATRRLPQGRYHETIATAYCCTSFLRPGLNGGSNPRRAAAIDAEAKQKEVDVPENRHKRRRQMQIVRRALVLSRPLDLP
jgi:hypothetical protein